MSDDPYKSEIVPFAERKRVTFPCCATKDARIRELEERAVQWMKVCTRKGEEHFLKHLWRADWERDALKAELAAARLRICELEFIIHANLDIAECSNVHAAIVGEIRERLESGDSDKEP